MELGIHYINFKRPDGPQAIGPTLAATARAAEQGGATMFTLADHFFQMEGVAPAEDPFLEGYTSMGFLAGQTESIALTMLVTGVTYRYPGVLAKTVTTLDVLSQGRAMLGIGAAWYDREHAGLGIPYPPLGERFEMLEETLQICEQMWSDNNGPFEGKHYRLAETLCAPQPIQRPRPPILIGGAGEKKTLRLVAQYGNACNLFGSSPEDVEHKLDVLRRHCDDVGRDYDEIRKTIIANNPRPSPDTRDEFVRKMAGYAKLGVHTVIVTPTTGSPAAWIDGMAPAVLQLAELG